MSNNFLSLFSYFPPKIALLCHSSLFFEIPNTYPIFKNFYSYSRNLCFFVSCQLLKKCRCAGVSRNFSVTARIIDQSTVFTEGGSMLFHEAVIFTLTRVLQGLSTNVISTCICDQTACQNVKKVTSLAKLLPHVCCPVVQYLSICSGDDHRTSSRALGD